MLDRFYLWLALYVLPRRLVFHCGAYFVTVLEEHGYRHTTLYHLTLGAMEHGWAQRGKKEAEGE